MISNNKQLALLGIFALVLPLVTAAAVIATISTNAAAEGVAHSKNFGQCKQLPSNDQACQSNKDKFTGPG